MPSHLANHIRTGDPVLSVLTLSENIKIMELLDAVIRSSESGNAEEI